MRDSTILVIIDATAGERQPALARAAALAKHAGAALELFACAFDPELASSRMATVAADARHLLLDQLRRRLEALAEPLRNEGLRVGVDVVWDHPLDEAIVKKVAAHDYWLVAKDTLRQNLLQRTLLTNDDWQHIRKCPAPLLLVKDRKLAAEPSVFAAVDPVNEHDKPAALDDRIVNFGADLARVLRGQLHVVHSYAPPLNVALPPEVQKVLQQEHRAALSKFLDAHAALEGRRHLYEGLAHECLQKAAEDYNADFVVMGAVARRGLKRVAIGSTAERALDRLPCDLVIIKPPELDASGAD